jgi:phosphopantetheinyl transferase (holo-ACP synthase)
MKVLGIGVDLVQNNRIQNILLRSSHDIFLQKILHPSELK